MTRSQKLARRLTFVVVVLGVALGTAVLVKLVRQDVPETPESQLIAKHQKRARRLLRLVDKEVKRLDLFAPKLKQGLIDDARWHETRADRLSRAKQIDLRAENEIDRLHQQEDEAMDFQWVEIDSRTY